MSALVSIIIPVYNRSAMLGEAVASALAQTYRPIEIIVVDDGSTDNTLNAARALAKQYSELTVLEQKNQGAGVARETGRLHASGEYIQYLDSDDLLLPNKLTDQVFALMNDTTAQLCYGKESRVNIDQDVNVVDWSNIEAIKATGEVFESIFPKLIEHDSLWGTSVPLWKSELTDQMGEWLPLMNEEDIEYDARAGALGAKLAYVDQFVAIQRVHDQHLSAGGTTDPRKLHDRVESRKWLLKHALSSGLLPGSAHLIKYAKSAFFLARMCAAQGMKTDTQKALSLSEKALGQSSLQIRFYRHVCRVLGPRTTQRLCLMLEQFRSA